MSDSLEHTRQSLRFPGYDYSIEGYYFITICTDQHFYHLGAILNDQMVLKEIGIVARKEWFKLPIRFPQIQPGPFCVMPNHIHGIIIMSNSDLPSCPSTSTFTSSSSSFSPSLDETIQQKEGRREKVTVGDIVGAYKSLVMKACLAEHKVKFASGSEVPLLGKIWQRNYYEHIIRTQESYDKIAAYIITNPQNWVKDKFYSKFE